MDSGSMTIADMRRARMAQPVESMNIDNTIGASLISLNDGIRRAMTEGDGDYVEAARLKRQRDELLGTQQGANFLTAVRSAMSALGSSVDQLHPDASAILNRMLPERLESELQVLGRPLSSLSNRQNKAFFMSHGVGEADADSMARLFTYGPERWAEGTPDRALAARRYELWRKDPYNPTAVEVGMDDFISGHSMVSQALNPDNKGGMVEWRAAAEVIDIAAAADLTPGQAAQLLRTGRELAMRDENRDPDDLQFGTRAAKTYFNAHAEAAKATPGYMDSWELARAAKLEHPTDPKVTAGIAKAGAKYAANMRLFPALDRQDQALLYHMAVHNVDPTLVPEVDAGKIADFISRARTLTDVAKVAGGDLEGVTPKALLDVLDGKGRAEGIAQPLRAAMDDLQSSELALSSHPTLRDPKARALVYNQFALTSHKATEAEFQAIAADAVRLPMESFFEKYNGKLPQGWVDEEAYRLLRQYGQVPGEGQAAQPNVYETVEQAKANLVSKLGGRGDGWEAGDRRVLDITLDGVARAYDYRLLSMVRPGGVAYNISLADLKKKLDEPLVEGHPLTFGDLVKQDPEVYQVFQDVIAQAGSPPGSTSETDISVPWQTVIQALKELPGPWAWDPPPTHSPLIVSWGRADKAAEEASGPPIRRGPRAVESLLLQGRLEVGTGKVLQARQDTHAKARGTTSIDLVGQAYDVTSPEGQAEFRTAYREWMREKLGAGYTPQYMDSLDATGPFIRQSRQAETAVRSFIIEHPEDYAKWVRQANTAPSSDIVNQLMGAMAFAQTGGAGALTRSQLLSLENQAEDRAAKADAEDRKDARKQYDALEARVMKAETDVDAAYQAKANLLKNPKQPPPKEAVEAADRNIKAAEDRLAKLQGQLANLTRP